MIRLPPVTEYFASTRRPVEDGVGLTGMKVVGQVVFDLNLGVFPLEVGDFGEEDDPLFPVHLVHLEHHDMDGIVREFAQRRGPTFDVGMRGRGGAANDEQQQGKALHDIPHQKPTACTPENSGPSSDPRTGRR